MSRFRITAIALSALAAVTLTCLPLEAGLQDFNIVNSTGFAIYEIYYSPSETNNWGPDMLGDTVLMDGEYLASRIDGHSECYWDIMAVDEYDESVVWPAVNLCAVTNIYLMCNADGCWAQVD